MARAIRRMPVASLAEYIRRTSAPAGSRGAQNSHVARCSDDAAFREIGDLLLRVAEPREDVVVGVAELRRRAAKGQALFTVRDRMSENRQVAERRRVNRLGHREMLHL